MSLIYAILAVNCFIMLLCALIEITSRLLRQQGRVELKINESTAARTDRGITLYEALANNQVFLPAACGGKGTCGHCAVIVDKGRNCANALERTCLSTTELESGLRLSCQQKIRDDMAVVIDQSLMKAVKFRAILSSVTSVSSTVRIFEFVVDEADAPDFIPGQYVQLFYSLPYERVMRAYSISSVAKKSGNLRFTLDIQLVEGGLMTGLLQAFSLGEELDFCGPYGDMCFEQHHAEADVLLIAGGVGLAPMRYIVQSLVNSGHAGEVRLYHGARTTDGLYADADLKALAFSNARLKYIPVLSAPLIEDGWVSKPAMIHEALIEDDQINPDSVAFICGPAPMVAAVQKVLVDKGISSDRILTDPFDF